VERNRNENTIRRQLPYKRRDVARHRLRHCDLAAIFEADRKASREIVIDDRGARPGNSRRLGQADAAGAGFRGLKRHAAGFATARAEEFKLLPAFGAETVRIRNHAPATRAPRRKREIENRPEQLANHVSLVA